MEREHRLQAYDIEKERIYTDAEIRKDTISYLSEYRLLVQKYDYELLYSFKERDGWRVRDVHREESMSIKAKRTLAERKAKGLPIHRELAEDIGIENLDEQLLYAQDGDSIFWMSPQGPKEQGYGNYGFIYAGEVTRVTDREKHIAMTAIRIENPTLGQSNDALSMLAEKQLEYTSAEDFLANPHVRRDGILVNVDRVLHRFFAFAINEEEEMINKRIIGEMDSMIDDFIVVIRTGTREEKIRAFYALENYAIELKERYKKKSDNGNERIIYRLEDQDYQYLADIISAYGNHRPPAVAGSCGPTGEETRSNDIFADQYKNLMKAIFGDLEKFGIGESAEDDPNLCRCNNQKAHFHCPGTNGKPCNHSIIVGRSTTTCPSCGAGKVC